MINENEFFRQATLRICGDLEIEQAMSALLRYLSQVMPADRMFLQLFDQGLGAMRTVAHSTQEESRKEDLLTPLSPEARAAIERAKHTSPHDVLIFDTPDEMISALKKTSGIYRLLGLALLGLLLFSEPVANVKLSVSFSIDTFAILSIIFCCISNICGI